MKIWLGGQAYLVTDEDYEKIKEHIRAEVIEDPLLDNKGSKGTRKKSDSEAIAIEWLKKAKIKPIGVVMIVLMFTALILDHFFPSDLSLAQIFIPALTTGAGVNTVSPAQTQVESDVLIGDIDTAMPLRGLKVNVDGDTTIDIQNSQPLVSVFSKLSQFICGTVIGLLTKIATGRVFCKAAVITFTNDAATTPTVYWNSQRGSTDQTKGRLIRASTTTINPSSNQIFNGSTFAYLAFTNPVNINSFDFTFFDGTQQNMTVVEADAFFAKTNEAQADGRLDALVTTIDNSRGNIASVKVNVGAVAIIAMIVK